MIDARAPDGIHALTAIDHDRPLNVCLAIPITVNALPLSVIGWPTIDGLPPNRRCQYL